MGDFHSSDLENANGRSANLADPVMLDKMDKLFACNVGDYVDLPQILVVGDQSSGKSSVLLRLVDLPFPQDSGLCTRFATQITFRRSTAQRIVVSIVPAKNSDTEYAARLRAWTKKIDILGQEVFANIMLEVHMIMGISDVDSKTFSDDVLCFEICGPKQEHLSVIDVPGIFKRTTQGVTSKADMHMVKSMVQNYMKNPRSIILAVIPANVDIATQEILEMAEEVDPEGHRTLGLLTKPDLVDRGAETAVVDLIEGRKHCLTLGWHLVRNPGQQESQEPTTDRYTLEQDFFKHHPPYNNLEKERVGVPALKVRLQEILATHTRREFPKVKSELNKRLKARRASLASLGASRNTPVDQSKYLIDIAIRFQEVSFLALAAMYSGDDIFDQHSNLKLATLMVNRGDCFSKAVQLAGHTYQFESETEQDAAIPVRMKGEYLTTRLIDDHNDIVDIVCDGETLPAPESRGILEWLTVVHRNSRGFELGTFASSILPITMKEQSKKWDSIALGYISDVVTIVHNFITQLLQIVCPDERVRNGLSSLLIDGLVERYKKAIAQVEFVLQVERSENPATKNHKFNDTLKQCEQNRMRQMLSGKTFSDCKHGTVVRLQDIISHHPQSDIEHTVQEIHDNLKSYYEVAWERAVDVICMQATNHHLISGPSTPLKLFSPAFIGTMTPEQLEEIAGEDPGRKRSRKQLQKEIEDLEKGKKILT